MIDFDRIALTSLSLPGRIAISERQLEVVEFH